MTLFVNPLLEAQRKFTEPFRRVHEKVEKMKILNNSIMYSTNYVQINETLDRLKAFESKSIEIQHKWHQLAGLDRIPNYNLPKYTLPENVHNALKVYRSFEQSIYIQNEKLLELSKQSALIYKRIEGNSELQFAFIANMKLSGDKDIEAFVNSLEKKDPQDYVEKWESKLGEFMIPLLVKHGMIDLWLGAQHVLGDKENPDKLRQAMTSLRTLLEHVIEIKFSQKTKNKSRTKKVEAILTKFEFHYLNEIESRGINYIGSCYATLCNIHHLNV